MLSGVVLFCSFCTKASRLPHLVHCLVSCVLAGDRLGLSGHKPFSLCYFIYLGFVVAEGRCGNMRHVDIKFEWHSEVGGHAHALWAGWVITVSRIEETAMSSKAVHRECNIMIHHDMICVMILLHETNSSIVMLSPKRQQLRYNYGLVDLFMLS